MDLRRVLDVSDLRVETVAQLAAAVAALRDDAAVDVLWMDCADHPALPSAPTAILAARKPVQFSLSTFTWIRAGAGANEATAYMERLCDALESAEAPTTVESVDVGNVSLSDAWPRFWDALVRCAALRLLTLSNCLLGADAVPGLCALVDACPALRELHVDLASRDAATVGALLDAIACAGRESELALRLHHTARTAWDGARLAGAFVDALARGTAIDAINLDSNCMSSVAVAPLLRALAHTPRGTAVRSLDLSYNGQIDDACAPQLGALVAADTALETLNLRGTCVGDETAAAVAAALRANTHLHTLILSSTNVTAAGALLMRDAIARGNAYAAARHERALLRVRLGTRVMDLVEAYARENTTLRYVYAHRGRLAVPPKNVLFACDQLLAERDVEPADPV